MENAKRDKPGRHRIVIVGAGFAGLSAAQALSRADADVIVIDRQNHHLFQPLLYQVATAGLSPADIASPIRSILRRQANADVVLAEVTGVDVDGRAVLMGDRRLAYDSLIVATGASHAYFGRDEWAAVAPGLKTIDDATALRRKILIAFERAETEPDAEERRRLQTFVVIGGGPTGVEMAADFRHIDPRRTRVVLIEAGQQLLAAFDAALSEKARKALEAIGVDVRLGRPVVGCDGDGVSFGDTRIESRTIVWAAGVQASAAGRWLAAETDRAGRVKVAPDLTLPGRPEIFVLGDTAHAVDGAGKPLPGIAPVAKQQGRDAARRIIARLAGRSLPDFRYRDSGSLATIGRKSAVVHIGRLRLSGWFAWVIWCVAHVYFLIGFRNRFIVAASWMWNYVTFQRGARLITGMGNVIRPGSQAIPPPASGPAPSSPTIPPPSLPG
jgi:NADH:ubiquinone reductase (H+-translocating)